MKRIRFTLFIIPLLLALLAGCASAQQANPTPSAAPSAATAAPASQGQGQTVFVIDPAQSQASYTVQEQFLENAFAKLGIKAGKVTVTGVTQQVEGEIHVNPDDLTQPPAGTIITVDLTRLKTDQSRRDKWIQEKGPNFLKYPKATFQAREIRNAPASYTPGEEITFQLAGDLTIRGVTRPVVADVTAKIEDGVLTGAAVIPIKMSDFGIEPPNFAKTLTVGDDVTIEVKIVAKQK